LAPIRSGEPATAKPTPLVPAATAPPTETVAPAGAGLLQIGAYKSQAEADAAWSAYKAKHATLLAGTTSDVKQVDLGAKGTWYRLRIATGDKAAAAALCEKLKAEGGACFAAK
jgi:cell division protein FtsN